MVEFSLRVGFFPGEVAFFSRAGNIFRIRRSFCKRSINAAHRVSRPDRFLLPRCVILICSRAADATLKCFGGPSCQSTRG